MSAITEGPSNTELLDDKHTKFKTSAEILRRGDAFVEENEIPCLETSYERRMRRKSHYVIYITTFIMSIGFSIILTGVWPYLKTLDPYATKELLGWVVAANPLGQMIFSPILGWYANKVGSNRGAFIVTICFSIVGNIMYALLPLIQSYEVVRGVVLASRFIVGVSGANVAICRSYIVSSTKLKERTAALSATAAAQAIGFILGPMIQSGITMAFEQSGSGSETNASQARGSIWNMYSTVGWAGAAICSINLLLYLPCVYQEHYIAAKESSLMAHTQNGSTPNSRTRGKQHKLDIVCLLVILFNFYTAQMMFVLLETLLVPIVMDMYALPSAKAVFLIGIAISGLGLLCFLAFAAVSFISKRGILSDRQMYLYLGFIPLMIAVVIHIPVGSTYPVLQECLPTLPENTNSSLSMPYDVSNSTECTLSEIGCPSVQEWCKYTPVIGMPQLIIGEVLAFSGYAVTYALSTSLLSKALGPKSPGIWMGVLTSTGGLARISGPLYVTYIYTELGPRWVFGSFAVVIFISSILALFIYKRIGPSYNKVDESPESAALEN